MKNILRPFSNAPIIVETDTTIASKPLHIAAINKPSPTQPLRVPQSDPAQKVAMQGVHGDQGATLRGLELYGVVVGVYGEGGDVGVEGMQPVVSYNVLQG